MINIIVCIKQVLDPEAPASAYKVDDETRRVVQKGVPPVMSPFDENALEAALRIKDAQPASVTVLSLGRNLSQAVLRKSLAAGTDELVFLEDNAFDGLDSYTTASVLAAAVRKVGGYDVILTGREAADTNAGVVGPGLAELLAIPSITIARKVEVDAGRARVERVTADGYEIIEAPLPVLITVSNELGDLRAVKLPDIMAAQKKNITTWRAADLGFEPSGAIRTELQSLFIPTKENRCELVPGETSEELGVNLALKLREHQII